MKKSDKVTIYNIKIKGDPFKVQEKVRKKGYYCSAIAVDAVRTNAPASVIKKFV